MLSVSVGTIPIPFLGAGIGYRTELRSDILSAGSRLDFVEITADHFVGNPARRSELEELVQRYPVVPHALRLSSGSPAPPPEEYLRELKRVSDLTDAPFLTDHLAVTGTPGIDFGHLSPVWRTEESLRVTARNVREVQDYLGKPLALETVTYLFEIPGATLSEAEFFHRLCEETGCGILLDVHNVYTNSVNHHFSPEAFLREFPLDHVLLAHVAGGYWEDGLLIDGHCAVVPEETWGLLRAVAAASRVRGVVLEHDVDFPDAETLLSQVERARATLVGERAGTGLRL